MDRIFSPRGHIETSMEQFFSPGEQAKTSMDGVIG
jgi:hypothetical protein